MTGMHAAPAPHGAMARRRDAARFRPALLIGGGLLVTCLLAGAIQLGNSVTALRREIQDLTLERENLSARQAVLSLAWNRATSRQVIMTRAGRELGLICPDAPGTVVLAVHTPPRQTAPWSRLRQHLPGEGGVASALAGAVRP